MFFTAKKVTICKKCSGLDAKELKDRFGSKIYKIDCFHKCLHENPELKGKVYGLIRKNLVICDTKEEFFEKIENTK
jgi:hypothetical protein